MTTSPAMPTSRAPYRSQSRPAGIWTRRVRDEERGREQADDGERDAVGVREPVGDGADVGDVPPGGEREHESPGRGAHDAWRRL